MYMTARAFTWAQPGPWILGMFPRNYMPILYMQTRPPNQQNHRNTRKIMEAASGRLHKGVGRLRRPTPLWVS